MGIRAFFAMDIDAAARGRIVSAAEQLRPLPGGTKATWTKGENLHVTMNFLGDVPQERIPEICELAEAATAAAALGDSVTFTIGPLVCTPAGGRARMIWAPVRGGNDKLASLHAAMNGVLAPAGLRSEKRPFKGHVTVARIKLASDTKSVRRAVGDLPQDDFGTVQAAELTLYSSELTPQGPIYTPLAGIPLAGQRR